jgi:hypothetical protein
LSALNRAKVTVQLIKASDGFQLWSESFDQENADIFAESQLVCLWDYAGQVQLAEGDPARWNSQLQPKGVDSNGPPRQPRGGQLGGIHLLRRLQFREPLQQPPSRLSAL